MKGSKWIGIALAGVLVFSSVIPAYAQTGETGFSVNAEKAVSAETLNAGESEIVATPDELKSKITSATADNDYSEENPCVISLSGDITLSETLTIPAGTFVKIVGSNGDEAAVLSTTEVTENNAVLNVSGMLVLENVTVDANKLGKGIYVGSTGAVTLGNNGTVMHGYMATSSTANRGSGVDNWGTLTLASGSKVTENENPYAGGIANRKGAILVMEDGSEVSYNRSPAGTCAGIANLSGGTFEMKGGSISYNSGAKTGTGVYNTGTFTMTGGSVSNNTTDTASAQGVGIYASGITKTRILGGTVSNNSGPDGTNGSGVGLGTGATLSVGGDVIIYGNTAGDQQNNVYLSKSTFYVTIEQALGGNARIGLTTVVNAVGTAVAKPASGYEITNEDKQAFSDDTNARTYELANNQIQVAELERTSGAVSVENEIELQNVLEAASDNPENPTVVTVKNNIDLSRTVLLNGHVILQSSEGAVIRAADAMSEFATFVTIPTGSSLEVKNVTLNANRKGQVVSVASGAEIVLDAGAIITGGQNQKASGNSYEKTYGNGLYVASGATATMKKGASISENVSVYYSYGIGVYNAGTFLMEGGCISDNEDITTASNLSSAGMGVYNKGTFTMTGGKISGNKGRFNNEQFGSGAGGGIYNEKSGDAIGIVNISGTAKIINNEALSGGGIYNAYGDVNISGPDVTISSNSAAVGGGIYAGGTVTIGSNDGTVVIEKNEALVGDISTAISNDNMVTGCGAGIYVGGGTVKINDGTIIRENEIINNRSDEENAADEYAYVKGLGAGIYLASTSTLNLSGGTITGNTATNAGSGIYAANFSYGNIGSGGTGPHSDKGIVYAVSQFNVSGTPQVTDNTGDDIVLAPTKLLEETEDDSVAPYPQVITVTGSLAVTDEEANVTAQAILPVTKEFYDYTNEYGESATDNILVQVGGEYSALTKADAAAITHVVKGSDLIYKLEIGEVPPVLEPDDDAISSLIATKLEDVSAEVDGAETEIEAVYTVGGVEPAVAVTIAGETLSDDCYDVTFADNEKVGTATITITLKNGYSGTITKEFTINAKDIADGSISVSGIPESVNYNGKAQTPAVTVKDGETVLTKDTDYTVTYANNTAAGTATVTIKGIGNYTGTVKKTFVIKQTVTTTDIVELPDGTMVYVENGKANYSYTGFAKNSKGWWYVENGKVNAAKNSVIKDAAGKVDGTVSWWYVVGGKVQSSYTGVANYKNAYGWWYIKNGKVDFSANTVAKNNKGWWYVVKGQVQFGYTGVANYKNAYGWWYVVNGKVDFKANTVAKNKYGWWYVVNGKVQFGYTGVANYKNAYGWWYVVNGKVDFKANTVAKNKYGWWKVTNGSVDFGFNGIAKNSYGWWYIRGGKVDFSYNGKVTSGGKTYTVKNGKVNR